MSFRITEVTSDADFKELVEVEFLSFESPPNAFRNLFYPILGTGPDACEIAIKEATARIIHSHKSNRFSHWIKAVDPQSRRLVGAALWIFFKSDPYTGKPLPECTWWPEGEGRDFTNIWWHKLMQPRIKYMSRRHAYLNLCFVHPEYRRRGAGGQLLSWGVNKAEEYEMVAYMDASGDGKALYEHYGFVAKEQITINFTKEDPGSLWKTLEKLALPHVFWPMSRDSTVTPEAD